MPTPTPGPEQPPLPFLAFTPAPVRARRDGWSPALQLRFVVHLARGCGVDEAARAVGRSRQTAYALRARAGAEGFAGAWDAALDFAREARGAGSACAQLPRAFSSDGETLLVPRFYRGRLVGYVLREDLRGIMAGLRRIHDIDALLSRPAASPHPSSAPPRPHGPRPDGARR